MSRSLFRDIANGDVEVTEKSRSLDQLIASLTAIRDEFGGDLEATLTFRGSVRISDADERRLILLHDNGRVQRIKT